MVALPVRYYVCFMWYYIVLRYSSLYKSTKNCNENLHLRIMEITKNIKEKHQDIINEHIIKSKYLYFPFLIKGKSHL